MRFIKPIAVGLLLGIIIMFKPYRGLRKKLVEERQEKPAA